MFLAPFTPDRDDAQGLAEAELAKGMYVDAPTLIDRFLTWLSESLVRLGLNLNPASGGAGSYVVIGIILALVVTIIVVALRRSRIGSRGRGHDSRTELFDDVRSAKQLFAAARKAQNSGDLNLTVIELYRAIIRELDERNVITVIPGMTALEAARAGSERIGAQELFARCASTFNEIYYWSGHATPEDVQALHALRAAVDHQRPAGNGPSQKVQVGQ